ncbi:hypothetical protein [Streptomyces ardesiacus]|uniref:hypothetical protein n=1 Tax=Streptomyces ardesiacus TaxID=285564 RepID=UPI0036879A6F
MKTSFEDRHSRLIIAVGVGAIVFALVLLFALLVHAAADDESVPLVIKAHRAVLERLALKPPAWPFRTFDGPRGFGTYWRANDMSGSWKARRDCIEQVLGPTRDALEDLEELEYERRLAKGPSGSFKNLIFAADGVKPEIVLRDAVNNEVEIVRHADTCLVFTDPLPPHGLTWRQSERRSSPPRLRRQPRPGPRDRARPDRLQPDTRP